MFKVGLLTSTAMTAVTLLLSGASVQAQTDMHVTSRNPNTRFLCTYGQFAVSAYSSRSQQYSSSFASGWTHVAVPVTGRGERVRRIRVIQAHPTDSEGSSVSAGIYSNNPSGFPGNRIAGGKSRVSLPCGAVTISIPRTRLKRSTKYWIEETVPVFPSFPTVQYWAANPNTTRKAYVQVHRYRVCSGCSASSSYTTPWTKQTTGPYFKLR